MANDAFTLFQSFQKKGMGDRQAIFAVVDHFNEQHWHDRNRYDERIRKLEATVERLEKASPPA